jgi:hypothetical protein
LSDEYDYGSFKFSFPEFMSRPIKGFKMEGPMDNCSITIYPTAPHQITAQLTLFQCCDIYGHAYQTTFFSLFRENLLVADMERQRCVRCGFSPQQVAYAVLKSKLTGKVSMDQARRLASQYLTVTRPSQSFTSLTDS